VKSVVQAFHRYSSVHIFIPNPRGKRNPRFSAGDDIQLFLCSQW